MSRKGGQLSGGQQQMMVIGRGLLTGPDLLLLDEPTQGLAPVVVNAVLDMLRDLKRQRLSVLLVEQSIRVALELADRVYVLNNGLVVLQGDAADLRTDPDVFSSMWASARKSDKDQHSMTDTCPNELPVTGYFDRFSTRPGGSLRAWSACGTGAFIVDAWNA